MVDLTKQVAELRFDILRNAIYHTARNQFLNKCMRVFSPNNSS